MGKKLVAWGGVMQLSNDTSKNSTSPPYLVKNERSPMGMGDVSSELMLS